MLSSDNRGFTLIELLVVLAIIGFLALISYPMYTQHILKVNRSHATVHLMEIASALEQYHVVHNTYEGATLPSLSLYGDNSLYQFELSALTESQYLLKATPMDQQKKDAQCGMLSLDQTGQKYISGTGKPKDCF